MSVRIIESLDGKTAALYDSGSMWAFGPVFQCESGARVMAHAFLKWLECDPRLLSEQQLERRYVNWLEVVDGE